MTKQNSASKYRLKCALFIIFLAIPITILSIRELQQHQYDLSSTEKLSIPVIDDAFKTKNIRSLNASSNKSNHMHAFNALNLSNISIIKTTEIEQNNTMDSPRSRAYRSYKDKLMAFKKYLNGDGKIIIIHQRKSGGTTLENWFSAINKQLKQKWEKTHSKKWNSTIEVREAYHFFHKILENNITWSFIHDPHSIYVTALRHPINRILSQYEFEWRWSCQRCDYKHAMERYAYSNMSDWTFMSRFGKLNDQIIKEKQLKIKKYAALDFNDWVHRLIKFEINNNELGTSQHRMQSVRAMYINNYFLWICCCNDRWCNIQRDYMQNKQNNEKIMHCFEKSLRILRSFDILLITEWMNDLRTQVYVNSLFFNDSHIEHADFIGMDKVNKPYPHSVTNRGKNYMISPENEEILYRLNSWDLKIYQHAKALVFDRVHTVWKDVFDDDDKDAFNELLYGKSIEQMLDVKDEHLGDVFNPHKELLYE